MLCVSVCLWGYLCVCSQMSLFDILVRTIRLVLTFSCTCGDVKGIVCYFEGDTCRFSDGWAVSLTCLLNKEFCERKHNISRNQNTVSVVQSLETVGNREPLSNLSRQRHLKNNRFCFYFFSNSLQMSDAKKKQHLNMQHIYLHILQQKHSKICWERSLI